MKGIFIKTIILLPFLFFVISINSSKIEATQLFINSEGSPLINIINLSQKSLDIEIYELADINVMKAILKALDRKVKVRIIQEPVVVAPTCYPFNPPTPEDDQSCVIAKKFVKDVRAKGGVYSPFSKQLCGQGTHCYLHGKMLLADYELALISTGNFSPTSLCDTTMTINTCNRDYTLVNKNPSVVKTLGTIFENDLRGAPYNIPMVLNTYNAGAMITVSPVLRDRLIGFIQSAKTTILIQNQYLKDPQMNAAIIDAAKKGVKVYVMVSSLCSFVHNPSQLKQGDVELWKKTYSAFEEAGVNIKVFTKSILINNHNGYLHAKAIVVDGKIAWVGSVNGSTTAIDMNREYGVFFTDSDAVIKLYNTIRQDFMNPKAITWQEGLTCKNDFGAKQ